MSILAASNASAMLIRIRRVVTRAATRLPRFAGVLALLLVTSSACRGDEIAGPSPATGHWRLSAVDGVREVAAEGPGQHRLLSVIDSAEVIFRRYGRAQDIRHGSYEVGYGRVYFSDTTIVTWLLRGDSIFVTRTMPVETENYVDSGTIHPGIMELIVRYYNETGALVFSRWQYTRIGETP